MKIVKIYLLVICLLVSVLFRVCSEGRPSSAALKVDFEKFTLAKWAGT